MDERDLLLRDMTKALDVLDDTLQQVSNVLLDGTPPVEERRRYALLQAAAILASPLKLGTTDDLRQCVTVAELLLAEIETREKAEEQS